MAFGIYGIVFPEKNIYIGSTIQSFTRRWRAHKKAIPSAVHSNYRVNECVRKYGCEDVQYIVIETTIIRDKKKVLDMEVKWVKKFKDEGWTILNVSTYGNLGGREVVDRMKKKLKSKEVRKKISTSMRKYKKEPKTGNIREKTGIKGSSVKNKRRKRSIKDVA